MLVGHETARHHRVAERRGCAGAVLQQCDVFGRQLNGKAAPELLAWLWQVFFSCRQDTHLLCLFFVLFDDHEGITTLSPGGLLF